MGRTVFIVLLFSSHLLLAQTIEHRVLPICEDSIKTDSCARIEKPKEQEIILNQNFMNALDKTFSLEPIEAPIHRRNDGLTIEQLHEWVGPNDTPIMNANSDSLFLALKLLMGKTIPSYDWMRKEIHIPGMKETIKNSQNQRDLASFDFGMTMGQLLLPKYKRMKKIHRLAGKIRRKMDYLYPIYPDELQIKEQDTTNNNFIIERILLEVVPIADFMSCLPNEQFRTIDSLSFFVCSTKTSLQYMIVREENSEKWNCISMNLIKGFICESNYHYLLLVRKYIPHYTQEIHYTCNYELIKVINKRKQKQDI